MFKFAHILLLDFDGVLTDNSVIVSQDGNESVKCSRFDGIGISRLKEVGVDVVVISTERNPVVTVRCTKLGVECFQSVENKKNVVLKLLSERNLLQEQAIYLGNDINDLEVLDVLSNVFAVSDAHEDFKSQVSFVTKNFGGNGAVREICDLIYNAKKSI